MRNPKIGREAQKRGREAEERVIEDLSRAGWRTKVSLELDHGRKTDVVAICPSKEQFPIQVSTEDKSSGERKRLARRGIVSVSLRTLNKDKQTTPEFLCDQCPLREHCDARVSTTLGATALTSMRAK